MKTGNFQILTAANIRMHYKYTLLPAIGLLFVILLIYGTANLDAVQSVDCLERMVALIGIPMFVPLLRQEHSRSLYEMIAIRPVSFRLIAGLRIVLSIIGTLLLILAFEIYMCMRGCSFSIVPCAFLTLAACMVLGFIGLLLSSIVKNTIGGYFGAFCFYLVGQTGSFAGLFKPVTNGVQWILIGFLGSVSLAILYFCKPVFR